MDTNPAEEWRRLSELYAQMGDIELEEFARDYAGLRETAQRVLRDEMLRRNLHDPAAPPPARPRTVASQPGPDGPQVDFTWKTALLDCETWEQAIQIREVLRRESIESWIDPLTRNSASPRVLVAADELDQAREVASRPIPSDVVELSCAEVPEYEAPLCPACGAPDPILAESEDETDQINHWLCESCGEHWSERPPDFELDAD